MGLTKQGGNTILSVSKDSSLFITFVMDKDEFFVFKVAFIKISAIKGEKMLKEFEKFGGPVFKEERGLVWYGY